MNERQIHYQGSQSEMLLVTVVEKKTQANMVVVVDAMMETLKTNLCRQTRRTDPNQKKREKRKGRPLQG